MNNKKRGSWISYVAPYLIIIAIIVSITMIFQGQGNGVRNYTYQDIISTVYDSSTGEVDVAESAKKSVLWKDDITGLSIKYGNGNYIDVMGNVKITENEKTKVYSFSVRLLQNETEREILSYIVANRLSDTDPSKAYYNSSNFAITDPNATNFWRDYFPTICFFIIGLGLVIFLITRMSGSISKSNNQAMDFNKSRARREDTSNIKFDDVAGCDEEKEEMKELVDYLKNPQKYAACGAKLPKGVLLVGYPGTGKTLLAKAVAGEAKVPFYSISGSDFVEMFVGVGAGRVRDMFKKAKQTAPCLIFIDEIDAVGRQRGAGLGGGNDEREQTLNQLLVEMDGFADNAGIIVIAATNRADVLDPALLRAGRFDRQITVDLPDKVGREQILQVHARNKKVDSSVDWKQVAKRTVGFSGADLANVVNEAAILTVRNKKEKISIKEVDEAIDRRIAGPAKKSKHITEAERKTIAYHEAGHAIIGLLVKESDKVQKITIVPRGMAGGYVLSAPEDDRFNMRKSEMIARITGLLGGRASEEVFFEDVSTGASNDIEKATRIARSMVVEYGMSSLGPIQYESNNNSVFLGRDYTSSQKNFSGQVANEIDKEIRNIIETAHEEAIRIIKEHRDDVILIAETLLDKETINAEEINYLMEHRSLDGFDKTDDDKTIEEKPVEQEETLKVTYDDKKED